MLYPLSHRRIYSLIIIADFLGFVKPLFAIFANFFIEKIGCFLGAAML